MGIGIIFAIFFEKRLLRKWFLTKNQKEEYYLLKSDDKKYNEIKSILMKLVSGEIKSACTMIEGVVITSSEPDFESGIDNAITAQLVVAGRIVEEALAIREKNFERMVITANSEAIGGFDVIIQRTGKGFIIVESKGILPGSPFQHADRTVGGTLIRVDIAADEIAKVCHKSRIPFPVKAD